MLSLGRYFPQLGLPGTYPANAPIPLSESPTIHPDVGTTPERPFAPKAPRPGMTHRGRFEPRGRTALMPASLNYPSAVVGCKAYGIVVFSTLRYDCGHDSDRHSCEAR